MENNLKFLLVNKQKGAINLDSPISEHDLFQVEKAYVEPTTLEIVDTEDPNIKKVILNLSDGTFLSDTIQVGNVTEEPGYIPVRGTLIVTNSLTLDANLHDQKTLICRNSSADISITIPSGLGEDFECNIVSEDSGTRFVEILAGTGVTLKAPHGAKILTHYTANIIKRTSQEVFNLQGELTP